jgi:hypothetical protein
MTQYQTDLAALRAIVRGVVLDYITPEGAPSGGGGGGASGGANGGRGGDGGGVFPHDHVTAADVTDCLPTVYPGTNGFSAPADRHHSHPASSRTPGDDGGHHLQSSPSLPSTRHHPRAAAASAAGHATRAALLTGAEELAHFFGRADSNDFLVPLLITCLNHRAR